MYVCIWIYTNIGAPLHIIIYSNPFSFKKMSMSISPTPLVVYYQCYEFLTIHCETWETVAWRAWVAFPSIESAKAMDAYDSDYGSILYTILPDCFPSPNYIIPEEAIITKVGESEHQPQTIHIDFRDLPGNADHWNTIFIYVHLWKYPKTNTITM